MCGIAWCSFSWEAFATLATGVLAVGGAVFVGLRQLKIAEKQVDIADRQTEIMSQQGKLADLEFRRGLFDRRMAVYDATLSYLNSLLLRMNDKEINREFASALGRSQFLFQDAVHEALKEVFSQGIRYWTLVQREGFSDAGRGEFSDADRNKQEEIFDWIQERMATLPELFAEIGFGGECSSGLTF